MARRDPAAERLTVQGRPSVVVAVRVHAPTAQRGVLVALVKKGDFRLRDDPPSPRSSSTAASAISSCSTSAWCRGWARSHSVSLVPIYTIPRGGLIQGPT